MPRNFERKDHSDKRDHRAREMFELYEDLRYFRWEQDYRITKVNEKLRSSAIDGAMAVVHEAAMLLEYPNSKVLASRALAD